MHRPRAGDWPGYYQRFYSRFVFLPRPLRHPEASLPPEPLFPPLALPALGLPPLPPLLTSLCAMRYETTEQPPNSLPPTNRAPLAPSGCLFHLSVSHPPSATQRRLSRSSSAFLSSRRARSRPERPAPRARSIFNPTASRPLPRRATPRTPRVRHNRRNLRRLCQRRMRFFFCFLFYFFIFFYGGKYEEPEEPVGDRKAPSSRKGQPHLA